MSAREKKALKLTRAFVDDHRARDLPMPEVVKETARHVWVVPGTPGWAELVLDARYYSTEAYYMDPPLVGLASSAKALLRAADRFWEELAQEAHQETLDRLDAAELREAHHG